MYACMHVCMRRRGPTAPSQKTENQSVADCFFCRNQSAADWFRKTPMSLYYVVRIIALALIDIAHTQAEAACKLPGGKEFICRLTLRVKNLWMTRRRVELSKAKRKTTADLGVSSFFEKKER